MGRTGERIDSDGKAPMIRKLEAAINKLSALPEEQQDAIADWLMAELDDETHWQRRFTDSTDTLQRMADEALAEHRRGETRSLPNADV